MQAIPVIISPTAADKAHKRLSPHINYFQNKKQSFQEPLHKYPLSTFIIIIPY